MINATITPAATALTGQLFRRATLTRDDRPDEPVAGIEWQFGVKRRGLHFTVPGSARTLATTNTKIRGFPPRAYYTLEVTGHSPEIPATTLHYRWFSPRLVLGGTSFNPQMMRTGDDAFLTFDTADWGIRVCDYETALHLRVTDEQLLLPVAFTGYFVWTYNSVGSA